MWLIDSESVSTLVTTSSDWFLIVGPFLSEKGYDMQVMGFVEVIVIGLRNPFGDYLG